mgnify:CR=1 FL=1
MKKKATKHSLESNIPSQQQLDSLLEDYQNGRFDDAEKLAVSIINDFPKHHFAWKVLGAVFGAIGRNSEALDANQTAVTLSPQDAAAHNNLGITYQELGKLEEAESSYRQAIALNPDFAGSHYNLGVTLKELGKLNEAELSCRQAIALQPGYVEAHNNLGITYQELGKLDEAESSYRQAIKLKPDYAEAHSNLGNTLQELGRLDEAEKSFRQTPSFLGALVSRVLSEFAYPTLPIFGSSRFPSKTGKTLLTQETILGRDRKLLDNSIGVKGRLPNTPERAFRKSSTSAYRKP